MAQTEEVDVSSHGPETKDTAEVDASILETEKEETTTQLSKRKMKKLAKRQKWLHQRVERR